MATTLAQVSDLHVCPDGAPYQGVADSNAIFAQAIHTLNQLQPPPDLVLITGRLTGAFAK
jgi:Icc protein